MLGEGEGSEKEGVEARRKAGEVQANKQTGNAI